MALGGNSTSAPEAPPVQRLSAQERVRKAFKCSVELEVMAGFKIALWGLHKTGKSHFAGTAPLPIYVIDTEGAWHLNRTAFPKEVQQQIFVSEVLYQADKEGNKVNVIAAMDAMFEALDALTDLIKETPDDKVGTIVIDSMTDLWDWLGIWKDVADLPGPGGRLQWGHANKRYTEFINMLLHSRWNVVATFKAEGMVDKTGADLGMDKAKWQKKTPYWFDCIAELRREETRRILILKGDRLGDIREKLEDPSFPKLVELFKKRTKVTF